MRRRRTLEPPATLLLMVLDCRSVGDFECLTHQHRATMTPKGL